MENFQVDLLKKIKSLLAERDKTAKDKLEKENQPPPKTPTTPSKNSKSIGQAKTPTTPTPNSRSKEPPTS
jgi:hypothetical protein